MAERAHPDLPGFRDMWVKKKLFGVLPYLTKQRNPYKEALYWRYALVNECCSDLDVLDVPCGMGWGTSILSGCRSLTGMDIAQEAIDEARQRYGDHVKFLQGSMAKLPCDDASLDLISCLEGIEHVPKETGEEFIAECSRVLRENGMLIMSSPHCNTAPHSGNPYHVYEYRPDEIRALVVDRFEVSREISKVVDNLTITMFYLRKKESALSGE